MLWRMASFGMWFLVALVRTGISEQCIASIIIVKRISQLGTVLAVTSNWSTLWRRVFLCSELQILVTANVVHNLLIILTLMMEVICSYEMLIRTRATWRHIPEDSILHSHRHGNLKSYVEPLVVCGYTGSMLSVDLKDQMLQSYLLEWNEFTGWYLTRFKRVFIVVILNALIMLSLRNSKIMKLHENSACHWTRPWGEKSFWCSWSVHGHSSIEPPPKTLGEHFLEHISPN
jgi:hypothetical protein